jgi:hypothetical protein
MDPYDHLFVSTAFLYTVFAIFGYMVDLARPIPLAITHLSAGLHPLCPALPGQPDVLLVPTGAHPAPAVVRLRRAFFCQQRTEHHLTHRSLKPGRRAPHRNVP